MITCFSVLIERLAMLVSARERAIHSLEAKRSAMRSAYWTRNGVASIDSSIAASTIWINSGGSSCRPPAWFISTKPNSPAVASGSAVRIAVPAPAPCARATARISPNLNAVGTSSASSTQPNCRTTTSRFSNMPMVTKNSPSSTSRNGLMSSST